MKVFRSKHPVMVFAFVWVLLGGHQQSRGEKSTYYPVGDEEILASIYSSDLPRERDETPIRLKPAPHLFLDDFLIESAAGVTRQVNQPQRKPKISNPVVSAQEDRCVGPYMTVIRDPDTGRFRIWYNGFTDGSVGKFATMESEDGIHWGRPARELANPGPIKWGCSVIDEGPEFSNSSQRFKLAWYARAKGKTKEDSGLMIATSADGIKWKLLNSNPLVQHNHDINNLTYDPLRQHYVYTFSTHHKDPSWEGTRRVTMQTTSKDLKHWTKAWYAVYPMPSVEHSDTQFYAMDGYLARGDLLIGMVKVLRDDLQAEDTPKGSYGMGYTTLAWTRDGKHWVRDTTPFFEPDPQAGTWDHAHAWIDDHLLVDDEMRLYYGGYKNGHKSGRTTERQLGLVTMPRDRYVARAADATGGILRTVPVILSGDSWTINANVKGSLEVRLIDADGNALTGFDYADCQPIRGDSLQHALQWKGDLDLIQDRPLRIEFRMKDAQLYGLNVSSNQ